MLAGCGGSQTGTIPTGARAQAGHIILRNAYGLGPTVRPKLTGTILGFDIDQHGSDGALANYDSHSLRVSLETFDQTTGKITKVVKEGSSEKSSYVVYGILAHDIGFVAHKGYELMNPVTGEQLNGVWTPPIAFDVSQIAENQSTPQQVMLGYYTGSSSVTTALIAADVAHGTGKVIPLDQSLFGIGVSPLLAQDSATSQAFIAADDGSIYTNPTIGIIDLRSGKTTTFQGVGYGEVDGLAVDPKTGTACTTTGTDAGVEFYDLKTQTGFEVQLPNSGGSEEHSGAGVAVDSVHGLCIVAQPVSGQGTQASAIWVVDEKGNFLEEIQGFNFWFGVGPAIDPSKRIGFIQNPRPAYLTLTGFSY